MRRETRTFVNALDFSGSYDASLRLLKEWGFDPVEYRIVSPENVVKAVAQFEQQIEENPYPSDGLVLAFDDLEYGESLGMTGKFPRNAIAFKWQDETAETVLRNVEWSASRTGLINPVAVFDTVQLEGTDVSRASLHNLRYMQDLQLGIGDTVSVYKANKIIPQLDENLTAAKTLRSRFRPNVRSADTIRNGESGRMVLRNLFTVQILTVRQNISECSSVLSAGTD